MRRKNITAKMLMGTVAAMVAFSAEIEIRDVGGTRLDVTLATPTAEARVGRPATPGSVAGVRRRTTRRTVRRVHYYNALPHGCYWRAPYHYCGGVYYQPTNQNGQTVDVIVNP